MELSKNSILIGVGALVVAVLCGVGYLWHTAEKSPNIVGGGYDGGMEEKQEVQEVQETQDEVVPVKPIPEEITSTVQDANTSENTKQESGDLALIQAALRQGIIELSSNDSARIRQYLTIIIAPEAKQKLDQTSDGELLGLVSDFRDQLQNMDRLMSHPDSEVEITDVGGGIVAISAFLEANGGSEQMGVPFRKVGTVWYPYLGPQ